MRSIHQYRLILGVLSKFLIGIQNVGYKGLISDFRFWHGPCDVCQHRNPYLNPNIRISRHC